MKTLVGFFDNDTVKNLISALVFRPQRLIFICDHSMSFERTRGALVKVLKKNKCKSEIIFLDVDCSYTEPIKNCFNKVIAENPEAVFELTGGNQLLSITLGMACVEKKIPCFFVDLATMQFVNVLGCGELSSLFRPSGRYKVIDAIETTGACVNGSFHQRPDVRSPEAVADIEAVFSIISSDFKRWTRFGSYLAKAIADDKTPNPVSIYAQPDIIKFDGRRKTFNASCDFGILERLASNGILHWHREGERLYISFKNQRILQLFKDTGAWLEYFTYVRAVKCGLFDDVQMSLKIDWDGDMVDFSRADSEIDIVLLKGSVPIFASCKIERATKWDLFEIRVLASRFGGRLARPALITGGDLAAEDLSLYKKAKELGIAIIDRKILCSPDFESHLASIATGDYIYNI